jgi:uncharacterized RDD family membrane protein YckC
MAMSERSAVAGGKRAGFLRRLLAVLLDVVVLAGVGYLLGRAFGQDVYEMKDGTFSYSLSGTPALISFIFGFVYYIYLEGKPGQTIGKKLMGIRIVDAKSGGRIGYGSAVVRYFGRIISGLPLGLGYFWMIWDDNKQTWHDKFANSVVVPTSSLQ